ncbi:OstA-like protein [Formosa sp. PL04]|uniref:OstA-like protein n=1 Tax=Formosa sp. PL04 TaxID=3081755 RepID=UPI0029829783|nr:OstA-like protein [Formosa sp. PL04]MDW5288794.1 OstA-like protein [Formosa sp. PL04]
MKTAQLRYIFLVFLFISFTQLYAQQQKRIKIEYSGFLTREVEYPDANVLTRDDSGQIHIIHEGVNMWCDKAIFYSKEDFIEAYGNVKMKQGDTINMDAKYLEYSGKTKLAFASGDVVLTEPSSVLTTDTLYFDRAKQQAFYKTGGTVVRDSSGTITSRIGRFYMDVKKYQFVNDVKLVNPQYILNTERLDYYTENALAYMYGPSTIVGESSKIYCERGFYDTTNDIGYFIKNSRIDYDNRTVEGDSLYFDRNKSYASATNNITVTDTLNKSVIKGHYAEVYRAKDSVFITKRALAISVQEKDSLYIHGDTLMVTGKPEHRITRAFRNVKLYKSDMSGKADSIHVDQQSGLTQLINLKRLAPKDNFAVKRRPILWNLGNQMTGDTIHIKSNTIEEKIDSLIVFENAFIISKDTFGLGFNQISGQRLYGTFNDANQLKQVDIIRNAESIYYARNDKQELIGIEKSKSASIAMFFEGNEINEVRKNDEVDGSLYPESKYPPNAKKLRGFDWREDERPISVEDLFRDDEPLNLPIIKGLDPYVPQDEFFDEELMKRAEKVEESNKTNNLQNPSKASRHFPSQDSIPKLTQPLKKPIKQPATLNETP